MHVFAAANILRFAIRFKKNTILFAINIIWIELRSYQDPKLVRTEKGLTEYLNVYLLH